MTRTRKVSRIYIHKASLAVFKSPSCLQGRQRGFEDLSSSEDRGAKVTTLGFAQAIEFRGMCAHEVVSRALVYVDACYTTNSQQPLTVDAVILCVPVSRSHNVDQWQTILLGTQTCHSKNFWVPLPLPRLFFGSCSRTSQEPPYTFAPGLLRLGRRYSLGQPTSETSAVCISLIQSSRTTQYL